MNDLLHTQLFLWETFIAVIEEGTLQKAAVRLQTTQPTVTRHIRQLEESLPLALFELKGRVKVPTPFAMSVYQKVQSRFVDIPQDIRHLVQKFGEAEKVSLRVGGRIEVLRRILGLAQFEGRLDLVNLLSVNLKEEIKKGQLDIIVTRDLHDTTLYVCKKLFQSVPTLVVPKKFLKGKSISEWMDEYQKFPLSLYSEDLDFYEEIKAKAHVDFVARDWMTIESRVQAGISWSVVPSTYVRKDAAYESRAYSQWHKKQPVEFYIYYRKELARQNWFKDFLKSILVN